MPVRKIPKSWTQVTGDFSSKKNNEVRGYESLLEKELMILLEFDDSVASFEEQPVKIPMSGRRSYTPDLLIHYHPPPIASAARKPLLAEVKHTRTLSEKADELEPKFQAARDYAAERNWEFRVITESEIRTPRLKTLQFLHAYREAIYPESNARRILTTMGALEGQSTVRDLLAALSDDEDEQANLADTIWAMVCKRQLLLDLDSPITNDAELWTA